MRGCWRHRSWGRGGCSLIQSSSTGSRIIKKAFVNGFWQKRLSLNFVLAMLLIGSVQAGEGTPVPVTLKDPDARQAQVDADQAKDDAKFFEKLQKSADSGLWQAPFLEKPSWLAHAGPVAA